MTKLPINKERKRRFGMVSGIGGPHIVPRNGKG